MAGIVRNIDRLGRAVIPMEFRRTLGIGEGDQVEISMENGFIQIKKSITGCMICTSTKNLNYKVLGREICKSCRDKIKEL